MRIALVTALLFSIATVADGALIGIPHLYRQTVPGTPSGYAVYDLTIDFEGQLFGQQMVLALSRGSIYQEPTFGGDTAPNSVIFPFAPEVAADTFVTMGGFTIQTSEDTLVVGGSTELGLNGPKQIDTQGINIAWAPAPGVVIDGGVGFPIARITLSYGSEGRLYFFSNSGGVGSHFTGLLVRVPMPEPSTGVLAALSLAACFCCRRVGAVVSERS